MNKEIKKYEKRFYILLYSIILSFLLGLFILFQKSPETFKEKISNQAIGFLREGAGSLTGKGIALLHVNGIIQFGSSGSIFGVDNYGAEYLIKKIKKYAKNKKVKGMILRINSPGGTIGATQELFNAIKDFRSHDKYVIASMADIAASGGYYIAAACDEIFANEGTITGSIGVIIYSPSFKGLFNKIGISYNVFKSGKHKDLLASHRDVTPEEKKILQSVVDDAYKQFFNDVKSCRKIKDANLRAYADGRIFTGSQAKKINLIDRTGDLAEVIKTIGIKTGLGEEPEILREKISPIKKILTMLNKKKGLTEKIIDLHSDNNINIFYMYLPY